MNQQQQLQLQLCSTRGGDGRNDNGKNIGIDDDGNIAVAADTVMQHEHELRWWCLAEDNNVNDSENGNDSNETLFWNKFYSHCNAGVNANVNVDGNNDVGTHLGNLNYNSNNSANHHSNNATTMSNTIGLNRTTGEQWLHIRVRIPPLFRDGSANENEDANEDANANADHNHRLRRRPESLTDSCSTSESQPKAADVDIGIDVDAARGMQTQSQSQSQTTQSQTTQLSLLAYLNQPESQTQTTLCDESKSSPRLSPVLPSLPFVEILSEKSLVWKKTNNNNQKNKTRTEDPQPSSSSSSFLCLEPVSIPEGAGNNNIVKKTFWTIKDTRPLVLSDNKREYSSKNNGSDIDKDIDNNKLEQQQQQAEQEITESISVELWRRLEIRQDADNGENNGADVDTDRAVGGDSFAAKSTNMNPHSRLHQQHKRIPLPRRRLTVLYPGDKIRIRSQSQSPQDSSTSIFSCTSTTTIVMEYSETEQRAITASTKMTTPVATATLTTTSIEEEGQEPKQQEDKSSSSSSPLLAAYSGSVASSPAGITFANEMDRQTRFEDQPNTFCGTTATITTHVHSTIQQQSDCGASVAVDSTVHPLQESLRSARIELLTRNNTDYDNYNNNGNNNTSLSGAGAKGGSGNDSQLSSGATMLPSETNAGCSSDTKKQHMISGPQTTSMMDVNIDTNIDVDVDIVITQKSNIDGHGECIIDGSQGMELDNSCTNDGALLRPRPLILNTQPHPTDESESKSRETNPKHTYTSAASFGIAASITARSAPNGHGFPLPLPPLPFDVVTNPTTKRASQEEENFEQLTQDDFQSQVQSQSPLQASPLDTSKLLRDEDKNADKSNKYEDDDAAKLLPQKTDTESGNANGNGEDAAVDTATPVEGEDDGLSERSICTQPSKTNSAVVPTAESQNGIDDDGKNSNKSPDNGSAPRSFLGTDANEIDNVKNHSKDRAKYPLSSTTNIISAANPSHEGEIFTADQGPVPVKIMVSGKEGPKEELNDHDVLVPVFHNSGDDDDDDDVCADDDSDATVPIYDTLVPSNPDDHDDGDENLETQSNRNSNSHLFLTQPELQVEGDERDLEEGNGSCKGVADIAKNRPDKVEKKKNLNLAVEEEMPLPIPGLAVRKSGCHGAIIKGKEMFSRDPPNDANATATPNSSHSLEIGKNNEADEGGTYDDPRSQLLLSMDSESEEPERNGEDRDDDCSIQQLERSREENIESEAVNSHDATRKTSHHRRTDSETKSPQVSNAVEKITTETLQTINNETGRDPKHNAATDESDDETSLGTGTNDTIPSDSMSPSMMRETGESIIQHHQLVESTSNEDHFRESGEDKNYCHANADDSVDPKATELDDIENDDLNGSETKTQENGSPGVENVPAEAPSVDKNHSVDRKVQEVGFVSTETDICSDNAKENQDGENCGATKKRKLSGIRAKTSSNTDSPGAKNSSQSNTDDCINPKATEVDHVKNRDLSGTKRQEKGLLGAEKVSLDSSSLHKDHSLERELRKGRSAITETEKGSDNTKENQVGKNCVATRTRKLSGIRAKAAVSSSVGSTRAKKLSRANADDSINRKAKEVDDINNDTLNGTKKQEKGPLGVEKVTLDSSSVGKKISVNRKVRKGRSANTETEMDIGSGNAKENQRGEDSGATRKRKLSGIRAKAVASSNVGSSAGKKRRRNHEPKCDTMSATCRDADALYEKRFMDAMESGVISLVVSGVEPKNMDCVNTLCSMKISNGIKVKQKNIVDRKTTICVMPTAPNDKQEASARTLKALECSLLGIPIVSLKWVKDCVNIGGIGIPKMFIRTLPSITGALSMKEHARYGVARLAAMWNKKPKNPELLFQNTCVFLCGVYSNEKKKSIIKLLEQGCANLISTSRDASMELKAVVKSSQKKISPSAPKKFVLLFGDQGKAIPKSLHKVVKEALGVIKSRTIYVVDSNWVSLSIACAKILAPGDFQPKDGEDLWHLSKDLPK